jgi:phosphohistidine phosphatase SixA
MAKGYIGYIIITAALTLCLPAPGRAQTPEEILIAAIQDGGKVIYLRHATTNPNEVDSGRLGDRAGQRNLTDAGRQLARQLGPAFRSLRIPVDEIFASPVYRARDTAELAFGPDRVTVTMDLVADDYASTAPTPSGKSQLQSMLDATARLLRTVPPVPGTNRILVGHRTPLEMVMRTKFPDTILPEGAMAIFLPGDATLHLLGTLSAERLLKSAALRRW